MFRGAVHKTVHKSSNDQPAKVGGRPEKTGGRPQPVSEPASITGLLRQCGIRAPRLDSFGGARIRPHYGRILAIRLKVVGLLAGRDLERRPGRGGRRLGSGVRESFADDIDKSNDLIAAGLGRNRVTIMQHGPGNGA